MIFGEYSYDDDIRVQRQEAFEDGMEKGIRQGLSQGIEQGIARQKEEDEKQLTQKDEEIKRLLAENARLQALRR